jgi:predicted transcriptional regulator
MTQTKTLETLLDRAASWPEEAQAELVRFMIDTEAKHFGVYRLSDEERAAIERGLDDIREGRFASDDEIASLFARYRRSHEGPLQRDRFCRPRRNHVNADSRSGTAAMTASCAASRNAGSSRS